MHSTTVLVLLMDVQVWYNEPSTSYTVCNGSGEDPSCSDSMPGPLSGPDHLLYLGIPVSKMCT